MLSVGKLSITWVNIFSPWMSDTSTVRKYDCMTCSCLPLSAMAKGAYFNLKAVNQQEFSILSCTILSLNPPLVQLVKIKTRIIWRMMVVSMFMIIHNSRSFLTAVTPTAVTPTAVILWILVISYKFINDLNNNFYILVNLNTCVTAHLLLSWLSLLSRDITMAFLSDIAMAKKRLANTVHKWYLQFDVYVS